MNLWCLKEMQERCACEFSRVRLFMTSRIIAHQTPLSIKFFSPEYWSRLLFPPLRDLPDPGIEPTTPASPALQANSLLLEPLGKPI